MSARSTLLHTAEVELIMRPASAVQPYIVAVANYEADGRVLGSARIILFDYAEDKNHFFAG